MAKFDHVFVVAMENSSYSDIIGNTTDCPYINNTLKPTAVLFSGWSSSGLGASQPDYLRLNGGDNAPTTTNANPPGSVNAEPSVYSLVEAAGLSWKAYAQSYALVGTPLSSTITDGDGGTGVDGSNPIYTEHHVPCTHYTEIRNSASRCQKLDDFTRFTGSADFSTSDASNTPNFAFITPDDDHNMHNGTGGSRPDAMQRGDTWLSTAIPIIKNSLAWTTRKCLLIVWWDEGATGVTDPPVFFCGSPSANPAVKSNLVIATAYTHYNALAAIEWALGLGNCGRNDVSASRIPEAFEPERRTPLTAFASDGVGLGGVNG